MSILGLRLMMRPAAPWLAAAAAMLVGAALRYPGLGYVTSDATDYLLPWYAYGRLHGVEALGHAFTNYTPAFSYLLLGAAAFDGLAEPLTLVKWISFLFEFGCAVAAAGIAWTVGRRPLATAGAASAVWLAPSVLHNGAWWGQSEAIWTFFLLLAILAFLRDRPGLGAVAFGAAVSVKLQAVFLGPLVLGLVLRRRLHPAWLAAIPVVYLALAVPTLLAGRPLAEVLTIYLGQAGHFRALSMNAANLYVFVPNTFYGPVTVAGLAVTAAAGLGFAWWIARAPRLSRETILLAASVTLLAMPFLLPKMHDRYVYGFEVAILILACLRPVYWPVALLAQVDSALAYFPFDGLSSLGLPVAALTNLLILVTLVACLRRATRAEDADVAAPLRRFRTAASALWLAYAAQVGLLFSAARWIDPETLWPANFSDGRGALVFAGLFGLALLAAAREARGRVGPPETAAAAA